jgi:hypothetical protein
MGKSVKVCFTAGTDPPEGLFIRALPIYADPSFLTEPVKRCPNHASLSDSSNTDFPAVSTNICFSLIYLPHNVN